MWRRTFALVLGIMLVVTVFGTMGHLDPMVASAEEGDDVLWQYGMNGVIGSDPNQLSAPCAAHSLGNGNILVADQGNNRVIEIDPDGNIVWQYGTTGVGGSGFNQLGRPAFDAQRLSDGNTLITDTENHRVIEVDPTRQIVWQYGTTGVNDVLFNPRDAERLDNGNTLISDTDHTRVVEVDPGKNIVWEFTNVQLPTDADRLPNGNTLISEPDGYRVMEVDPAKQIVWQYGTGTRGHGAGQLGLIWDADRLPNGNTLITDTDNHRVIEVTIDNEIVWQYGQNGTMGVGHDLLNYPYDAERLPDGSTLIADFDNHRVIQVGPGEGNLTVLFSDDFGGDLSDWILYGTPRPFIDNGALKGNGDGTYGSDATTSISFDRTLGDLIIEARIKISQTLRPGWFGFGSITSGDPDISPSETVYYGFRFQGTLYGELVSFTYRTREGTQTSSSIPWAVYDEWHTFRVVILRDGGADYFIDNDLKFSVPISERESVWSNESIIAGSHDPPYWFDDVLVMRRELPPKPIERFGLVVSTKATVYDLGDEVEVSAFHWSLATALPVTGESVSFQVDAPDGATVLVRSVDSGLSGWANLTFRLSVDGQRGPYTVYASTERAEATSVFRVGRMPLFIASVSLLETYLPGQTMNLVVITGSSVGEVSDLLLVVQILDPNLVPFTPLMDQALMLPYDLETVRLTWVVPFDAIPGRYDLQVQLMTGLPRDHGYAIDVRDSTFDVG